MPESVSVVTYTQDKIDELIATAVTRAEFLAQGPSGRQLAYAESNAAQSGITAVTDVTGLSISFTVGDRPVDVEAYLPGVYGTTIGTGVQLHITDAAGAVKEQAGYQCGIDIDVRQIVCMEHITTPGDYVRKVRLYRNAPGSPVGSIGNGFGLAYVTSSIKAIER